MTNTTKINQKHEKHQKHKGVGQLSVDRTVVATKKHAKHEKHQRGRVLSYKKTKKHFFNKKVEIVSFGFSVFFKLKL